MFVFLFELGLTIAGLYFLYRIAKKAWFRAEVQEKTEELSNVIELSKLTEVVDKKEALKNKKKVDRFLE